MPKTKAKPRPAQKETKKSTTARKASEGVEVAVVGVDGKARGKVVLPKELFGIPVNKPLLAQAVRVYLANQRKGTASTKTRGEVEGSTRKIYRQKGTGRARHGAIRSPIFVGGGIVFGPKPRDFRLSLPKQMKRRALACALSAKVADGAVKVIAGLGTIEAKTKLVASALSAIGASDNTLLVTGKQAESVRRAGRNLSGVDLLSAQELHPYAVLSHKTLVMMKEAIEPLVETFGPKP